MEATTDRTMTDEEKKWYVLRDFRRANTKVRAYQRLAQKGFEVFTPMKWALEVRGGREVRAERPAIPDLLIVHSTETELAPYVTSANQLLFRFVRGGVRKKMVVGDDEMERFMRMASEASSIEYYSPEEFAPGRIGKPITIKGGQFDGEEGVLLDVDGKRRKRIVVRLSNLFVAVIELKWHIVKDAARQEHIIFNA